VFALDSDDCVGLRGSVCSILDFHGSLSVSLCLSLCLINTHWAIYSATVYIFEVIKGTTLGSVLLYFNLATHFLYMCGGIFMYVYVCVEAERASPDGVCPL
jgi:hypothetical protein